jgi:hypothetical protein
MGFLKANDVPKHPGERFVHGASAAALAAGPNPSCPVGVTEMFLKC